MSTYELSKRLKAIGWPIAQSGLVRIENGKRKVDADDLLALALVLSTSPNALALPAETAADDSTEMIVTPQTRVRLADMWAWANGERPLTLDGQEPPSGSAAARFVIEASPVRAADALGRLSA